MDIKTLAESFDPILEPRLIRFLISEGVVPPPEGGRRFATYGEAHLAALGRYTALRQANVPLKRIKEVMASTSAEPVPVLTTGQIDLRLSPDLIGSGADPEPIIAEISQILRARLAPTTETDHAEDGHQDDRPPLPVRRRLRRGS